MTEYMPDQSIVEYSILWVSYVIVLWIIRKTSTDFIGSSKIQKPYDHDHDGP
jgi:hypothetical protein